MIILRDLCRLFLEPDFQRIAVYEVSDDGVAHTLIENTVRVVGRSEYGECCVQGIDTIIDGDPVLAVCIMAD